MTVINGYLAVGSALSGVTFTEIVDTGYSRAPITLTYDPGANELLTSAGVTFGPFAAAHTIGAYAVYDASGDLLFAWTVNAAVSASGTFTTLPTALATLLVSNCLQGANGIYSVVPTGSTLGRNVATGAAVVACGQIQFNT